MEKCTKYFLEATLVNIKNIIFILGISGLFNLLTADILECQDVYTSITSQKGNQEYKTENTKGRGNTKLSLEFVEKDAYIIVGTIKTKLLFINKGSGAMYFIEKTSSGNIDLLSIFDDGTLSILKSYDILGMAKANVQTIYKCILTKKN